MIDKSKQYKIINTLTSIGEISDSAKHRIGRTGKFLRLTVGMRFEFSYSGYTDRVLKSSSVTKIDEIDGVIEVHTLNTIYVFELVEK